LHLGGQCLVDHNPDMSQWCHRCRLLCYVFNLLKLSHVSGYILRTQFAWYFLSMSMSIIDLYSAESWGISTELVLSGSVFSDCTNLLLLSAGSRRLSCGEFQAVGPATEKARRLRVLFANNKYLTKRQMHRFSYIVWNFHLNWLILLETVQENKSVHFISVYSVLIDYIVCFSRGRQTT